MAAAVQAIAKAQSVTPLFLVPDVMRAAEYYRDYLGFHILDYYGEPPCFVFVRRDRADIMLKLAESPDQVRPNGAHGVWDAYLWIDDFDAIREELAARGRSTWRTATVTACASPRTLRNAAELRRPECPAKCRRFGWPIRYGLKS